MPRLPRRERRLLLAVLLVIVLLNVPYGRIALYPFTLFSTWIHELCHGVAAMLVGGSIAKLEIFSDGSGLATTYRPDGRFVAAFIASAGYVGTALVGAALLALRNRPLAGRVGLTGLGLAMGLSVLLWVRNPFGVPVLGLLAAALVLAGTRLPRETASQVYAFLAVTCCLNAFTSIRTLFAPRLLVDGRPVAGGDAHAVADALLLPSWFWASLWLVLAAASVVVVLRATWSPASTGGRVG